MNRRVFFRLSGIHYAWIVFAVAFITLLARLEAFPSLFREIVVQAHYGEEADMAQEAMR